MSRQRYQQTRKPTPATLTERELHTACKMWQDGGHLALGNWACKVLDPWDYKSYGALVEVVRRELNDTIDYSQV